MKFNFGLRRLQKIKYSYMLPLPPGWVKDKKIEKGDLLKIEMLDNKSLIITPVLQARQDSEITGGESP